MAAAASSSSLLSPSLGFVCRSGEAFPNREGFTSRCSGSGAKVIGLGGGLACRSRGSGIGIGSGQCALSVRNTQQRRVQEDRRYLPGFLKMSATEGIRKRYEEPQIAVDEGKDAALKGKDAAVKGAVKGKNIVGAQLAKPGVKSLVVAVAIPLVLGSIDAFFNSPSSQWFKDLKKPWWEPPGPVFGGAWSILYPLQGLASWLVWADGGFHAHSNALVLYISQLVLNLLWPLFFFGWNNLGLALVDILALVGVLTATIKAFTPINHVAGNLLKPYLAWIVFATLLNFNLWISNRGGSDKQATA